VAKRTFYRIALNPGRALANILRGKGPWHREGRSLLPQKRSSESFLPAVSGTFPARSGGDYHRVPPAF
jgi:hypothetical protein